MRLLVTGGAGYIGSIVAGQLLGAGSAPPPGTFPVRDEDRTMAALARSK